MITQSSSSAEQQFAVVVHAPLPFLLVCVVLAGAIWWALNWRYDAKIDRITEERDRYKALHERDGAAKPAPPLPSSQLSRIPDTGLRLEFGTALGQNDDGTLRIANHGEDRPLHLEDMLNLMNSLKGKTSIKAKDLTRSVVGKPIIVTGKVIEVSEVMDRVSISIALDGGNGKDSYMIFDDDRPRLLRLEKDQNIMVHGIIKLVDTENLQLTNCVYIQ